MGSSAAQRWAQLMILRKKMVGTRYDCGYVITCYYDCGYD